MGATDLQFSLSKILISSCLIFVTLVVSINLIPYYSPSVSSIPTNSSADIIHTVPNANQSPLHRDTCMSFSHGITFKSSPSKDKKKSWDWMPTGRISQCGFHRIEMPEALDLVNGSWIVVAGDSECRLTYISLLEVFVGPEEINKVKVDFTYRHEDYSKTVDDVGLKVDFLWRPFVQDLTGLLSHFDRTKMYPNLIVMGSGLWEMLHVNKASEYLRKLEVLREHSCAGLLGRRVPVFWVAMPTLVNSKLNTEVKRARLTDSLRRSYDDALRGSKILRQSGGPMLELDLRLLSDLCGPECAADGMHYDEFVYEAAAQILLNLLAIWNKRPNLLP